MGDSIPPVSGIPPFRDGEFLKYKLHYGFINGGTATISLKQEKYENKDVFHAVVVGKTTGLVDKIFRVKDIFESYFDVKTTLPYKAIRNVSEGNYKLVENVIFDRHANIVKSDRKGLVKVPTNCLDMISAFFYIRRIDFTNYKIGDMVSIDTYFDGLFPFYIIYKGKETIDTELGKIQCLKFVPIVEPGRIFKENDDMTFWLSDDQNKLPVSVKFEMIVGSFKCDLIEYQNIKYELKSKVQK
ncbi:MAG: DUF3108 domain-containing protein [Bacteroidetes bacterium]|nr:DUF3108 domain-containing protein [Bacteroidota bacterium]